MQKIFEVAIIGAGISGMGASYQLSKSNIDHIIIESRNRIGGRIASKQFDGITIHTGASFVHNPSKKNKIAELMKELNW